MIIPLITLSDTQRAELEDACKHHQKPYMREKCAALLKVAQGASCRDVAASGLLLRHAPDSLSDWIAAYTQHGLEGLLVKKGRGRKPAFSPCVSRCGAGEGTDLGGRASRPTSL